MKKNEMVIGLALLAVFLAALIAAGVAVAQFGFSRINQAFDSLEPQTGIVLGVSALVALLCSALIGRAIGSAKQREIDSHLRSERVALYHALMESLVVPVSEKSTGGRDGTGDLIAVERALFLRGSVLVNSKYRALSRLMSDLGSDEKLIRSEITKFLIALRRDCGQSTYGLESEDWSDLVCFPSRQVAPERNADSPPPHFPGAHAAPPTHRLSPRG
jgi:hypothetical protein